MIALSITAPSLIVLGAWLVMRRPTGPVWTGPVTRFPTGGPLQRPSAPPPPPDESFSSRAAKRAERERRKQEAEEQREGQARREATSAALMTLRDETDAGAPGCARFAELGVRAEAARRKAIGATTPMNDCFGSKSAVRCVEFSSGYFVPVDAASHNCAYQLWRVPKRTRSGKPVRLGPEYYEDDLAFTVRILADDIDRDGETDALVVRGWVHPEGVASGTLAILLRPAKDPRDDESEVRLGFEDLVDRDGDGRVDGIVSADFQTGIGQRCDPPDAPFEPWNTVDMRSLDLVAHRTPQGTFTFVDGYSRQARAKTCASRLALPIAAKGPTGAMNESEMASRLICQLAEGGDPVQLAAQVESACKVPFARVDCDHRRPGVCDFDAEMARHARRFTEFPRWLFDAGQSNDRDAGTAR